eukprot:scaffold3361_cov166-Amphora_coffeaeformis.AAC.5
MGKQRKPRNRRGRKETKQQPKAEPSGPPLLSRIRHADPFTRLAALTALAQRSSGTNQPFDAALWQAVCEQVIVRPGGNNNAVQLSAATIAATIMAEWTATPAAVRNTATATAQNSLTAGWPLVLQGQLQTCLSVWCDPAVAPHRALWAECAWQCLYAWTALIEFNSVVMDRLTQQASTRMDALKLLKEWLLATTTIDSPALTAAVASNTSNDETTELKAKLAETTARALHSLMQDNPGLVEPWWDDAADDSTWLTTHVPIVLKTHTATSVTRLHLAGVWMTCRNILPEEQALQNPAVLRDVVDTLQDALKVPIPDKVSIDSWQVSFANATQQNADDLLERQVVRKQSEKHESARSIARRLAKNNKHVMKPDDSGEDNDDDHDDAMDEEGASKPGQLPVERPDHVQNWEDLVQVWENNLRPLELALEIIAHLTAVAPDDNVMMEDDDGDVAMQSAVWDPILKHLFQELPVKLFQCFQALHSDGHILALPEPMALHWSELQSKASTGLGHCLVQISRDGDANTILGTTRSQFWQTLWLAIRQTRVASPGRQSALGLVVVALQTLAKIRKEVAPAELDYLIGLLQQTENVESPAVLREAVIILGILCSQEDHAADVNQSVCAALIGRLQNKDESLAVRAEVLNVLMDIYGNDDCHPSVFEGLKVLSHFERSLPILKQQISQVDRQTVDSNDVEFWRETALNVARFIEYKYESS